MAKLYNVTIIINPDRLGDLKSAMDEIGICGMTVTHVEGYGTQKGKMAYYRGTPTSVTLLPKTKVEIVVSKIPVETVIEAAKKALETDDIGAGKIFVYDVEHIIRVRTGETDEQAL